VPSSERVPAREGRRGPLTIVRLLLLEHPIRAIHLRPAADLAPRVLLPGDPHRALALAQELLDAPKMFNHTRGLWGYTGAARDGEPLTIQSTGMGGPSAAIVCEELIALGAETLVRVGTCGALAEDVEMGELLAVESVLPADGASRALGANGLLEPDPALTERLVAAGARPATVATSDLFFDPRDGVARAWVERGAVAVEMEAAAIFQVAARRGVPAACVLGVTDVPAENGSRRATPEQLTAIGLRAGAAGYSALAGRRVARTP
jgi:uridine phosphorylase